MPRERRTIIFSQLPNIEMRVHPILDKIFRVHGEAIIVPIGEYTQRLLIVEDVIEECCLWGSLAYIMTGLPLGGNSYQRLLLVPPDDLFKNACLSILKQGIEKGKAPCLTFELKEGGDEELQYIADFLLIDWASFK